MSQESNRVKAAALLSALAVFVVLVVFKVAAYSTQLSAASDQRRAERLEQLEQERAAAVSDTNARREREELEARAAEQEKTRASEEARLAKEQLDAWLRLTPTEHLSLAEKALSVRYSEETRTGGDLKLASKHLGAVPADSPESPSAKKLLVELDRREKRAAQLWAEDNLKRGREALAADNLAGARSYFNKLPPGGPLGDQAKRGLKQVDQRQAAIQREQEAAQREQERRQADLFRKQQEAERARDISFRRSFTGIFDQWLLSRRIDADRVEATGRDAEVLSFRYALCSRLFMLDLISNEEASVLRERGFASVECRSYFGSFAIDL
jgi:hypothetical protein